MERAWATVSVAGLRVPPLRWAPVAVRSLMALNRWVPVKWVLGSVATLRAQSPANRGDVSKVGVSVTAVRAWCAPHRRLRPVLTRQRSNSVRPAAFVTQPQVCAVTARARSPAPAGVKPACVEATAVLASRAPRRLGQRVLVMSCVPAPRRAPATVPRACAATPPSTWRAPWAARWGAALSLPSHFHRSPRG
jgi:hypothetical protein